MKLTDAERAENREALARMTLAQKLGYLWEYYKFPLALILIAATALGSALYYRITWRDPLLYVGYANVVVGDALSGALDEGFVRSAGADPRRAEVKTYRSLYLTQDASVQDHQYSYASRLKIMAAMTGGQLDVMLMNQEAYDIMSAGGYLLPLEGLLSRDSALFAGLRGHLAENTVILEENGIEHTLDERVPYRVVTETKANAIRMTPFPLFEQAGFSGEVFLGVVGNSSRLDTVLQYIRYLTAESESPAV